LTIGQYFYLFSIYQILMNVLWLDGEPESNVNPESPKDISQGIPSVPVNPPSTRTQSFESENDSYKTESKSCNVVGPESLFESVF